PTPMTDMSTMNKVMEYMAFELPTVAFDLTETRVSAAGAATYAEPNDVRAFAKAVDALLDDPAARTRMGAEGRRRVEDVLAWEHQAGPYVDVYRRLIGDPREP
ncbi:MAG: glycosyltransferase, partial [Acidimicrobiia bacterium]|nr:glycosyltransferase [Acidimicrobiia bacterium]